MRSTRTAAASAALLTLTFLAGCGGGDDDKKSSDPETTVVTESPSTSATSEATTTSPTTDTSVSPMDPTDGADVTQDQLDAALLTPEEVGADFVAGSYADSDDPPPCDPSATPLDQQVPPTVQGGVEIDHSSGQAAMQEEISIYGSDDDAANALTLGTNGLACSDGTLPDGSAVKIEAPQDVTADVDPSGLGTSTAYSFSGDGYDGVLIITIAHQVILTTTFQSATGAATSTLPNPVDVAATAWAKALAN